MASQNVRKAARLAGAALAAAGVGFLTTATPARAANPTTPVPSDAQVTVGTSITLTLDQASFTLTGPAGATVNAPSSVTGNVVTNDPNGYTLTVLAATPSLVGVTPGNTDTIPIGSLSLSSASMNLWSALSTSTPKLLISSMMKSAPAGDSFGTDFRVSIPATVNQDTYQAAVTYTATGK